MMSRSMVKSKASSVQPIQHPPNASHWSLVGSFHHGVAFAPSCAHSRFLPCCLPERCKMHEFLQARSIGSPRGYAPSALPMLYF
jgi:hypothetical protein